MTRMIENTQSTSATTNVPSENQIPNQSQNTTSSTSTNPNMPNFGAGTGTGGNFLQGILGNLMSNPNSMLQMTSMILGDNDLDLNSLLQGPRQGSQTEANPNQPPTMNLNNLLNNILNPNPSARTSTNQATTNTTTPTTQNLNIQNNGIDNQYPMLNSPNESLANLENVTKTLLGDISTGNPNVPRLNYTKNVLTSLGETLKTYYNNVNRFLPVVLRLAECLERESLIQSQEERQKVQSLISTVHSGFEHITKATGSLQPLFNGLEYGQNPGQGHLRLVTTIGTQVVVENFNTQTQPSIMATSTSTPSAVLNSTTEISSGNMGGSTGTIGSNPRANPMQDMLSQLTQPDNMRAMMSMVGNLLGNTGNASSSTNLGASSTNRQNANPLNNLFSQLLNNMGGDMMVDNEVSQNEQDYFTNLSNDQNARKTTLLKDIPQNILKLLPNPDFAPFTNEVLSEFSVHEILSLKSLNFRGFTRQRRNIREKLSEYAKSKFNSNYNVFAKKISENISQILIITENETDKMINNNFNLESHFENFFLNVLYIFSNVEMNDAEYELNLTNIFIKFFDGLFNDLIKSYNTGKDGALNFLDYNFEYLLEAIIGKEALNVLVNLNQDLLGTIIDELMMIYESKKYVLSSNKSETNKMLVDIENTTVKILFL
jgi:hypothetical protein